LVENAVGQKKSLKFFLCPEKSLRPRRALNFSFQEKLKAVYYINLARGFQKSNNIWGLTVKKKRKKCPSTSDASMWSPPLGRKKFQTRFRWATPSLEKISPLAKPGFAE
jgi:hypothetical protein